MLVALRTHHERNIVQITCAIDGHPTQEVQTIQARNILAKNAQEWTYTPKGIGCGCECCTLDSRLLVIVSIVDVVRAVAMELGVMDTAGLLLCDGMCSPDWSKEALRLKLD